MVCEHSLSNLVVERLVASNTELLGFIRDSGAIGEGDFQFQVSKCPWCGAGGDEGLVYEDKNGTNGNRCASCGHWVPYG
jgi:hypothetical protein